uniref:Uncharacterized protein n=1 Tax=Megaselia scalaris TaxID=36166 RepID=T1GM81_MEGSC
MEWVDIVDREAKELGIPNWRRTLRFDIQKVWEMRIPITEESNSPMGLSNCSYRQKYKEIEV